MKKELEKLLKELEEEAQELIALGYSHEKGKGHGMQEVITAVREVLDRYMGPEDVKKLFPDKGQCCVCGRKTSNWCEHTEDFICPECAG
ncbi:MAG: hypothetical protein WC279_13685 [Sulfurimonas sp.]|jgi:hypothetical protein|uniref:hypothetical protein n=1 Tax=Sulfurimonas sp. TaxID=2022749 RepID=UPI003564DD1A